MYALTISVKGHRVHVCLLLLLVDTMVRGHLLADREAAASHNSDIVILAGDIMQLSWSWTQARIFSIVHCVHMTAITQSAESPVRTSFSSGFTGKS